MSKALVIVESPAKAKTINKYLGSDYVVKSSVGHVRDLSTSSTPRRKGNVGSFDNGTKESKKNEHRILVNRMGVDPWHNWKARYEVLPGKEKVISELKELAKKVDHIYLATDLDREGEAIAWHLRELIGGDENRYSRVIFNEITKNAIQKAFEKPSVLNIDRVNAQQARRFLDRVVGYMISPLLWKKIARGLSAGRVQSVALRMVVEREREIKAFVSKEFWKINANISTPKGTSLTMEVTHQNNHPFRPESSKQAMDAVEKLKRANYQVLNREDQEINSKPNPPFITSTLQQASSTYLGIGVKKTMILAQLLYESGYITYMRTDSTNLSRDSLNMVRDYISKTFGHQYLPESAVQYGDKENSQEAHEAIRPTDVTISSKDMKDVETDARKLYQLIWRQFIASQMMAAKYTATTLTVVAADFYLKARGRVLRFDGWRKVMPMGRKEDEDRMLPEVKVGDDISLLKLIPEQHFTKPPTRFSEGSLVKELEKRGIGRPSTYSSIISTIQERGYVRLEQSRFYAEKIGEIVTDRLANNFRELMSYDFTAQMEERLDKVANHKAEWKKVLDTFFKNFIRTLDKAKKNPEEGGMQPNQMVMTSINCPACRRNMVIRTAMTGVFLGCSGYTQLLKNRCKTTLNLVPEQAILNVLKENNEKINPLRIKRRCKKCGTEMDTYLINSKRKLYICGNNPACDGYESEEEKFPIEGYQLPIIKCQKCGSDMNPKIGRFGKYMSCSNDGCKSRRKILTNGELAPEKEEPVLLPELLCEKSDAYFVLRNGSAGIFLAASTFPKSRETRPPLVEELYRFRDRLPEKLRYLADAPQYDSEGKKTLVLFSRKTKQQYISTERRGKDKDIGWSAFFIDGKWIEDKS